MNRLERTRSSSHAEAINMIHRRIRGISRSLEINTDIDIMRREQQELATLRRNYQALQPLIDANIYRRNIDQLTNLIDRIEGYFSGINANEIDVGNEVEVSTETIPIRAEAEEIDVTTQDKETIRYAGRFFIDKVKLESLISLGFTIRQIAREGLLGQRLHHNTIHNFMKRSSLTSMRQRYTTMTDNELKVAIQKINLEYPNSGTREVVAHLKIQNPPILVQRERCARILSEIDPVGTAIRFAQAIHRRQYNVPSPNSLWHLDSNHSLVEWGFIVFGQIDGFSRLISQLHLSTNNKASTAILVFIKSIKEYAVPSRIRLDGGSEFNHVEFLMNFLNGEDRASVMRGPSVHNTRIERLWRDVYAKALDKFYRTFRHMQDHGILDKTSPIHMFSLQYVYGPRIQQSLKKWARAHNNHPVRTEGNKTPIQLWYAGSISSQHIASTAMENLFRRDLDDVNRITEDVLNRYNLTEPDDIKVVLPRYATPLTDLQLEELKLQYNPLRESASEGIDIYASVVNFILSCINEQ